MRILDVKEHTNKHLEFAKRARSGCFPNKEVAKIGSLIGTGVGSILVCVGFYGIVQGSFWGMGSFISGLVTIISNIINLKRIGKNTRSF